MSDQKASGAAADLADDARAICLSGQEDSREANSTTNEKQPQTALAAAFARALARKAVRA